MQSKVSNTEKEDLTLTKNEHSTRYHSNIQESYIADTFGGHTTLNSGAARFSVGDVVLPKADMLIECKCKMKDTDSFSIKKDWLAKLKEEQLAARMSSCALAFSFDEDCKNNYFIINESLMRYLVEKLTEDSEI